MLMKTRSVLKDSELNALLASPIERHTPPAPAPAAPLPPIAPPRHWFNLYEIIKVVLGLYLFGEDLPLPVQIAGDSILPLIAIILYVHDIVYFHIIL